MEIARALLLLASLSAAAAQSREPTEWDVKTDNCSATSPATSQIDAVEQVGVNSVKVTYQGYTTNPTQMWLTDEAGTIIAYTDDNNLLTSPVTLTFSASSMADQPSDVRIFTCPPYEKYMPAGAVTGTPAKTGTMPATKMWRGVYEDETNNCCSDNAPTAAQLTAYMPTLTSLTDTATPYNNLAGSWQKQEFKFTTTGNAPLVYALDNAGRIISLKSHTAAETTPPDGTPPAGYTSPDIGIPAYATSVRACSLPIKGDTPDQQNPLCAELSFLDRIADNLEADTTNNPATMETANWFLNISYSGTASSPVVTYSRDVVSNQGETCINYAKNDTTGTVIALAVGNVDVNLIEAATATPTGTTIYVYSCCGVTLAADRQFPYVCPANSLHGLSVDLNAETTAAQAAIAAAKTAITAGVGALSLSGAKCGSMYSVGDWVVNASAPGTAENCTCTGPAAGEIDSTWVCTLLHGKKTTLMRDGTLIGIVLTAVFAVIIVVIALVYAKVRNATPIVRTSQFGTVHFDRPGGPELPKETETYT